MPFLASAATAATVAVSFKHLLGPSGSSLGSQQFAVGEPHVSPSILTVQDAVSQVSFVLQLGPPSVAKSTYFSPLSALPTPVVKYAFARVNAAAVGVPPEGGLASSAARMS